MSDDAFGALPPDQPLFTASVAADMLGLHPRTLRVYEEAGLISPARTPSNRRQYSRNDLRTLALAARLAQERGVNLAGLRMLFALLEELQGNGIDAEAALERALEAKAAPVEAQ